VSYLSIDFSIHDNLLTGWRLPEQGRDTAAGGDEADRMPGPQAIIEQALMLSGS